jgi:hypothetical protein
VSAAPIWLRPVHDGSVEHDTGRQMFPKRHQELAGKRHDRRLFEATAVQPDQFQNLADDVARHITDSPAFLLVSTSTRVV